MTQRQQEVLEFIRQQQCGGGNPTLREIAAHFKFRSMNAAFTHVQALRRKGLVDAPARRARSLRLLSSAAGHPITPPAGLIRVPVYGSIPAGRAADRTQESEGTVMLDAAALGVRSGARLFALRVAGDSMIGRNICDGDLVVIEQGVPPKTDDVVAALIDGESTLKTYVADRDQPHLRAENPRYPNLVPATELVIQGVMIGLVRRSR